MESLHKFGSAARPDFGRRHGARVPGRIRHVWIAGICFLVWTLQPLNGAYRKEQPIALIVAAEGGRYRPFGLNTTFQAHAGVFLFEGDMLYGSGGSVRVLWCPEEAAKKFEYTIQGKTEITLNSSRPSLDGGKELDVCMFPALERAPEVTTLPSLDQMLPPPLTAAEAEKEIAQTPPDTAAALHSMARRNLNDPRIRISFATMLERAALDKEAVDQFREIAKLWPDQVRIGRLILDLLHSSPTPTREIIHPKPAPTATASPPKGNIYALVIGINQYAYANQNFQPLHFAAADAIEFARFMASARGGSSPSRVVKLIDADARIANIRNHLTTLLAELRKNDTFVLFIAGHGDTRRGIPVALTYFSNPEDPSVNDFPLTEIQKIRFGETAPFREVRVFLDICHAGFIGPIDPPAPRRGPQSTPAQPSPGLFFLPATHEGPDAHAYEDLIFGHGVFSYFLLRGLESGEAQAAGSHYITAYSLKNYVSTWVEHATTGTQDKQPRQVPTPHLSVPLADQIANINDKGPDPVYTDTRPLAKLVIPDDRLGTRGRQGAHKKQPISSPVEVPAATQANLDRRIALEDEGETILLRYLEGDEIPQKVEDFRHCAGVYSDALKLQPGSAYLDARCTFCKGRALVFDRRYDDAIEELERAIQLDPTAAYSYNALGIAYLEKGDYGMATGAFIDAIGLAPKWAYPRHNLALVHTEQGNYDVAVADYRDAMTRTPEYSYLPYNLGLLFQRMNRLDEAEVEYRLAISKASHNPPGRSEPYGALGMLKASEGKWTQAEEYYRAALSIPADELTVRTVRHNLAVLLDRKKDGRAEAESLWRQNGDYVPSQLLLAESLAARGQTENAIQLYRDILCEVPDHLSARLKLAAALEKRGDHMAAISELRTARAKQPDNPLVLEQLAASLAASGNQAEAVELYRLALAHSDAGLRSRIQKALKRMEQTH